MTDDSATDTDEIKEFQKGRYISPPEAFWRIYEFRLNEMTLSVYTLQVHLPNQRLVSFPKNSDLLQLLAKVDFSKTMLTEFFKMNATNATAENLKCFYKDFPQHFIWSSKYKHWAERKSRKVIGRLVSVNPREGEREVALALGLLQFDTYIEETLEEAAAFQMPSSLRLLFATLLVYCSPTDPTMLWKKFEFDFSRDYQRHKQYHDHSPAKLGDWLLLILTNLFSRWDEASMAKRETIEAFDDLLRDIMEFELPFGGKVIVFGGDFRQTLPVIEQATKEVLLQSCFLNSPLWYKLHKLKLTGNMRAILDPQFFEFLLRVGEGHEPIDLNSEITLLLHSVFPNLTLYSQDPYSMINRCILTPKNNLVDELNDIMIRRSQTVLLSLWDDFLNNEDQVLLNNMQSYPVIIGRRLKVSNYNGVALSTWFDSALLVDPPIQEARAMRNTKLIAEIIDAKSYIKYNPVLCLKTDQKTTLICNVIPSQKDLELRLEFVHAQLKTKTFLVHIKPVQTQLADAGQHYTILYCSELEPEFGHAQLTGEPESISLSANQQTENEQLLMIGDGGSGSKVRL
ncbi:uncharacterized protein [Coffea arabica]|uniref:ATP-dependent DNA helicase n=1 Tax=Coffea arabica TaxID=13443 RepID=A0ABM4UYA9_COFAR